MTASSLSKALALCGRYGSKLVKSSRKVVKKSKPPALWRVLQCMTMLGSVGLAKPLASHTALNRDPTLLGVQCLGFSKSGCNCWDSYSQQLRPDPKA